MDSALALWTASAATSVFGWLPGIYTGLVAHSSSFLGYIIGISHEQDPMIVGLQAVDSGNGDHPLPILLYYTTVLHRDSGVAPSFSTPT